MGAAGSVTVYLLDEVERKFKERFPEHDLQEDLWYLRDDNSGRALVARLPGGTRLLFDYADDCGDHEGFQNSFWFSEGTYVDRGDLWVEDWQAPSRNLIRETQWRVLTVLKDCWKQDVEVWT